jgi:hypothetical protein
MKLVVAVCAALRLSFMTSSCRRITRNKSRRRVDGLCGIEDGRPVITLADCINRLGEIVLASLPGDER